MFGIFVKGAGAKLKCESQRAGTQSGFVSRILFAIACVMLMLSAQAVHASDEASDPVSSVTTSLETRIEAPAAKKRYKLGWKMGLSGESFANEKEQAQTAGFALDGDLRYALLRPLELKVKASVGLQSGYAQTRFGDNAPKSGVNLKEAVVQYKPVSRVALQAGAIDQDHLGSPLLVSNRAFPGALEKILIGPREFALELRAQQTVPTSTTLSTKTVDAEVTPSFGTETLVVKSRPIEALQLKVFGTHYAFRDLPTAVAMESEVQGNTVKEAGPNTSRFAFEYEGWVAGGGMKWQILDGLAWNIEGQMLKNTKAQDTYSNGQWASTGLEIGLPGEIALEPKAEVFFAESDVAPAFYNSADLGHTNRQGWAADVATTFKRGNFKIGARYADADVINPNLVQSRQAHFILRFETLYEFL